MLLTHSGLEDLHHARVGRCALVWNGVLCTLPWRSSELGQVRSGRRALVWIVVAVRWAEGLVVQDIIGVGHGVVTGSYTSIVCVHTPRLHLLIKHPFRDDVR